MLSEHESSNSAGGEESDWVDETLERQEESCDRSCFTVAFPASQSAATDRASPFKGYTSDADEVFAAAAPSVKSRGSSRRKASSTRGATSAGAERKKDAAVDAPAASCWGHGRPSVGLGSGRRRGSRKVKQQLHEFRCKGFTFEWGGDAAADIPAYDLSPSFKLLRLSLDGCVDDAPADILRGFFRAFEAAGEAARSDLAAGASLTFHVDKGDAAAAPSSRAATTAFSAESPEKGRRGVSQSLKQKGRALAASYFAPLGDELYVGRSPQHLQLLSPNRFIGTISVTAASPTAAAAGAAAELQTPLDGATAAEDDGSAGADAPSHKQSSWEKESSFPTWHQIRVIGAATSTLAPAAGGAAASGGTAGAEEEAAAFSVAAEDEHHGRKSKKKKKAKSKQKDELEMYEDDANE